MRIICTRCSKILKTKYEKKYHSIECPGHEDFVVEYDLAGKPFSTGDIVV